MNINEIIEQYRKGDADTRMSLFLYHQGLREAFEKIEQYEPLDPFIVEQEPQHTMQGLFRSFSAVLRNRVNRLGLRASVGRTGR